MSNGTGKRDCGMALSHEVLMEQGVRWLNCSGYPIVFTQPVCGSDGVRPDVLAFNPLGASFLLESVTSRAELQSKQTVVYALGDRRGYITPAGLVTAGEVPYGWWLLEVSGDEPHTVEVIKGKAMVDMPIPFSRSGTTVNAVQLRHISADELKAFENPNKGVSMVAPRAIANGVDLSRYSAADKEKQGRHDPEKTTKPAV